MAFEQQTMVSGVLQDPPDLLSTRPGFVSEIDPRPVDLRKYSSERREQQMRANACVAFAFAKGMEIWNQIHRDREPQHPVSRMLLWYMSRQLHTPDGPVQNIGVSLASTVSVAEQLGLVREEDWPWNFDDIFKAPSYHILQRSYVNTVQAMARPILKVGAARVSAVHAALQKNKPVVFSAGLRQLWITYSQYNPLCHGVLEPLAPDRAPDVYHAMVILGYDMDSRSFIIENSFGGLWGYDGFGYVSEEFVAQNLSYGYWVVESGPRWID